MYSRRLSHRPTPICLISQWLFQSRLHRRPRWVDNIHGCQSIEYTITAQYYEIGHVFIDGELWNFGNSAYDTRFAAELDEFSFDIAKSTWNTQTPRQNTIRAIQHLPLSSSDLTEFIGYWHILKCLSLINLAAIVLYPVEFCFFIWAMILRQIEYFQPAISW